VSDPNNDLLIEEVDDEVRSAQMKAFWQAWGMYIIGLAVFVVVVVAGREIWMNQQIKAESEASMAYDKISKESIAADNPADAWQAGIESVSGGYADLAAFRLAAAELDAGNLDSAIAAWDSIISDSAADPTMKDLARIQSASVLLQKGDYAAARGRASVLTGDDSAWDMPARELIALIDLQEGKLGAALQHYQSLQAEQTMPASMKERVTRMAQYLSAEVRLESAADETANEQNASAPSQGDATIGDAQDSEGEVTGDTVSEEKSKESQPS